MTRQSKAVAPAGEGAAGDPPAGDWHKVSEGSDGLMVGAVVAVAIVIVFFFLAGVAAGVFWIFSRSVRMGRKPGPSMDRNSEPDEDSARSDQGSQSWPFRH